MTPALVSRNAGKRRWLPVVVITWACCGMLSAAAWAAPVLEFEEVVYGDPPLSRSISITLEPATGEYCVTDEHQQTVNVFDAAGNHRYQTSAISQLSRPRDASIDTEGGFVLTDVRDNYRTIRRLNFLGEPVPYEPELPREDWSPRRLRITRDGNFITLDRDGLMCCHDGSDGSLIWTRQITDRGADDADLLGRPAEAPDGSLYVANGLGGVVFVFGPDGEPRAQFGKKGSRPGEFAFPIAVCFAADGRILVLDQVKHKIAILDENHDFLAEWGRVGFPPGTFYNPTDFMVTAEGRVHVTQGFEGRIQVFRLASRDAD